jgi:hypothetical protein
MENTPRQVFLESAMGGGKDIDRDRLILDWMRSNEAFKGLARHYGKLGKPALPQDTVAQQAPAARPKPK